MSVFLKVKLKSLAAEARVIKHEENKRKVLRPERQRHTAKTGTHNVELAQQIRRAARDIRAQRRGRDWYPKSAEELQKLHLHRTQVVKKEARLTSIAYGYIRGRKFVEVDSGKRLTQDDWKRVADMIKKYGTLEASLDQWVGR